MGTIDFIFLLMAFCLISFGGILIIYKKPLIFDSKWMFLMLLILYIPLIIYQIIEAFPFDNSTYSDLYMPLLLTFLLIYIWFVLRGYTIIGVNSESFRNALVYALQKSELKYTESVNKIILTDLNTEIKIGMQSSSMGRVQLRWKTKEAIKEKAELVNNFREYFNNTKEKANLITPVFFIIIGIIILLMMFMIR